MILWPGRIWPADEETKTRNLPLSKLQLTVGVADYRFAYGEMKIKKTGVCSFVNLWLFYTFLPSLFNTEHAQVPLRT